MKHLLATIGLLFGIALSACLAQVPGPGPGVQPPGAGGGQGRVEAYKTWFLTQRMNLTPEEGQRFWPIYNQYTAEMRQVQLAFRDNRDELAREEAVLNIRKKYNFEFSRALPREKVNMFFRSERDFNNSLQRELIQRRQDRIMQRRQMIR
ncbi:MAG: hypothetical protein P4L51_29805 [Puia sp.]|nr:hypothetical protein [Puia sp.]